jgi:dTDP-glucose 4,6-dehydratase
MKMPDRNNPVHRPRIMLVTGGAGFIGSNFIRHQLSNHDDLSVVNLDALTYAGTLANLEDVSRDYREQRYRFVEGDICDTAIVTSLLKDENVDTLVNFAAESHVDRSITGPAAFIRTNIQGTFNLLDCACRVWDGRSDVRFHHISTDEVYGSLGETGFFTEDTPYDPSSPYSASKSAADHLVRAWTRTYRLPATLTNCSNNFGPYHFPEKLIPLMIMNAVEGMPLPVYGDGKNVRDWLFVDNHCDALDLVIRHAEPGSSYNIGGGNEWTNIDLVLLVCDILQELRPPETGHYRDLVTFVEDRPGHDRRYAIDASRIRNDLAWEPRIPFRDAMELTIKWCLENQDWIDRIRREKYSGERLGLKT